MCFFTQILEFIFPTSPAFFINVYSCSTCLRFEATTMAKGSGLDEWESFIEPSGLLSCSSPPLPAYSPMLTTPSSHCILPRFRPPYCVKRDCLFMPGENTHTYTHTYIYMYKCTDISLCLLSSFSYLHILVFTRIINHILL